MHLPNLHLDEVWKAILKVGSLSGLVSLVFTISNHVRKRRRFSFEFRSSSTSRVPKSGMDFYELKFNGAVKNESTEPNSIVKIGYVVWGNKSRTRSLTYGGNAVITDPAGSALHTPILFSPLEGKSLHIEFSIVLTGSHDWEIVKARRPVPGNTTGMTLPKYQYQLVFTDINGRLFDQTGQLRSQRLVDLWWTLPNSFNVLKQGNPLPYLWRVIKIGLLSAWIRIRRSFWRLGL